LGINREVVSFKDDNEGLVNENDISDEGRDVKRERESICQMSLWFESV